VPRSVLLAELTREQIRALAPGATVVLPTAAIEQHGPHLPTLTDTAACGAVCQRAAEAAGEQGATVLVAPVMWIGHSHHHFPHPGVLSLSTGTFVQVLRELGDSLVRTGFRRIAIVNGHGGNDELVRVAARDIHNAYNPPVGGPVVPAGAEVRGVSVAATSYWTAAWAELVPVVQGERHGALPGHAGAFETSLVLALRPELVDQASYPPALPARPVSAVPTQTPTVIRAGESLGAGPGYTDDPRQASAAAGERYLEAIARGLSAFLIDFHRGHPSG
jgi:creatinine amidohydrolase